MPWTKEGGARRFSGETCAAQTTGIDRWSRVQINPPAARTEKQCLNLECAEMSALWNDATCRVVGKRQLVAALQIKALPTENGAGQEWSAGISSCVEPEAEPAVFAQSRCGPILWTTKWRNT